MKRERERHKEREREGRARKSRPPSTNATDARVLNTHGCKFISPSSQTRVVCFGAWVCRYIYICVFIYIF